MLHKKLFALSAVLILLGLTASCDFFSSLFFPETQTTVTFTGRVLEVDKALEGVRVEMDGTSDVTNSAGQFTLSGVSTGPRELVLSKPSYVTKTYNINVRINPPTGNYFMDRIDSIVSMRPLQAGTLNALDDTARWEFQPRADIQLFADFGDGGQFSANLVSGQLDTVRHFYKVSGNYQVRFRLSVSLSDTLTLISPLLVKNNRKPVVFFIGKELDPDSTHYFINPEYYTLHVIAKDPDSNLISLKVLWGDSVFALPLKTSLKKDSFYIPVQAVTSYLSQPMALKAMVEDADGSADTAIGQIIFQRYPSPEIEDFYLEPTVAHGNQQDTVTAVVRVKSAYSYLSFIEVLYPQKVHDTIPTVTLDTTILTITVHTKTNSVSDTMHVNVPDTGFVYKNRIALGIQSDSTSWFPFDTTCLFTIFVHDSSRHYKATRTAQFLRVP